MKFAREVASIAGDDILCASGKRAFEHHVIVGIAGGLHASIRFDVVRRFSDATHGSSNVGRSYAEMRSVQNALVFPKKCGGDDHCESPRTPQIEHQGFQPARL